MQVRHVIDSQCWSVDDDQATQCWDEWEYISDAIRIASKARIEAPGEFVNVFPGDHYRLLAGLVFTFDRSRGPLNLIDIGTHVGLSARTMLDWAPDCDHVHSFDIVPWQSYPETVLKQSDFPRLNHHVEDLAKPEIFAKHVKKFDEASIIMCDGPKDGKFEAMFMRLLSGIHFTPAKRFLLLDDIRFPSEMPNWRAIKSPKIDLTSFGHFSGTGLVDITHGFDWD